MKRLATIVLLSVAFTTPANSTGWAVTAIDDAITTEAVRSPFDPRHWFVRHYRYFRPIWFI